MPTRQPIPDRGLSLQRSESSCSREQEADLTHSSGKPTFQDSILQDLAQYGVALHHAGLDQVDGKAVEDGFRNGSLFALVSTSVGHLKPQELKSRLSPLESTCQHTS